jgi:PKD repeat protein
LPISSGNAPLTIQFQDTSTNSPTLLEWDFTNDGTVDSNLPNPIYTFATSGTYSVRLRAQNNLGASEKIVTFKIDPTSPTTTQTNLEIKLTTASSQVVRNTLFSVNVLTRNEGLATATNVARRIVIPDVGSHQVSVSNLPPGSTTSRSGKNLIVDLPVIPTLSSGGSVNTVFSVLATPIANQTLVINASVSSPESDPQPGDNTTSLSVLIRP